MAKRGFTLLEVLIALGVLVALGALVSASLVGFASGARFDGGVRRIGAALVLARADAQREGRALSVVALEGGGAVMLMVEPFEPEAAEGREQTGLETRRATEEGPQSRSIAIGVPDHGKGSERARRRLVVLPAGVRISSEAPEAQSGKWKVESGHSAAEEAENAAGHEGPETVRLCVMLPDGSAWAAAPVYVIGGSRAARLVVNRWTGAARAEPVEPASDDESAINTPAGGGDGEKEQPR